MKAKTRETTIGKERAATSTETPLEGERQPMTYREKGDLAYMADMAFFAEQGRIRAEIRLAHLEKTHRRSPDTEDLYERAKAFEEYVDSRLALYIVDHPVWPWASRIKGIGKENLPKVVGLIEKFATYYPEGDHMIPAFAKDRQAEAYWVIEKGDPVEKRGVPVIGIERLMNPSKLWKYSGFDVVDGHSPRRETGSKLAYNSQLRMALWRLGGSLLKAGGIWYAGGDPEQGYSRGYCQAKSVLVSRMENQGITIKATPKGRLCEPCGIEVVEKATLFCPQCGERLSQKSEEPGTVHVGHLHMMAMRSMLKDFEVCLWIAWRQALGLPTPEPYSVRLGHKPIDPWKMVDR